MTVILRLFFEKVPNYGGDGDPYFLIQFSVSYIP